MKNLPILATTLFSLTLLAAPLAQADTYIINFNQTSGSSTSAPTGSFAYDAGTSTFSDFIVSFDGNTFNLTSRANNPNTLLNNNSAGTPCAFTTVFDYFSTDGSCAADNRHDVTAHHLLEKSAMPKNGAIPGVDPSKPNRHRLNILRPKVPGGEGRGEALHSEASPPPHHGRSTMACAVSTDGRVQGVAAR